MHWFTYGLTVIFGLLYANLFEWVIHKYVLHGLGRKRASFWSFHWLDHHSNVRRNGFVDPDYKNKPFQRWDAQTKEILALLAGGLLHLPLLWVSPVFFCTLMYAGLNYYFKHRKSHLDPEWAKNHVPWHWDHHMGADQNLNWGVTRPWWDYVFGTRKDYLNGGTESC